MTRPGGLNEAGLRVTVIAVDHPPSRPSPLVPELVDTLRGRGCVVDRIDPDREPHDLAALSVESDVYVLKSGTEAALSYAGALHVLGAQLINPYPVAAACRDKIVQTAALAAAGVPVPQSWLVTDPAQLHGHLAEGPLIVKDPRGSQGRGLTIAHRPDDLEGLGAGPWLAMRYHRPEGRDLKCYRIGEEIFAVERPFPARTYQEKLGRLVEVGPRLERLVRRCGEAFGIELYGVDVIRHRGELWVVDMSSFPGFKGVPEPGRRIADLLLAGAVGAAGRARRRAS